MGKSSIISCVYSNDIEGIKQLLKSGGNINETERGMSALHIAIVREYKEVALFLIDNGIDLNIQDDDTKASALHYCAVYNQVDVAKKILEANGDLNIEDSYGNQPLWTAVFNDKGFGSREELVKLFLEYNADKNHKNKVGKSPLDIVKIAGYKNLEPLMGSIT